MIQYSKEKVNKIKLIVTVLFITFAVVISINKVIDKRKDSQVNIHKANRKQRIILFGDSVRIIENIDSSINETRLSKLISLKKADRVKLLFDEKARIFYLLEHNSGEPNINILRLFIDDKWLSSSQFYDGPYLNQTNVNNFTVYRDKSFIDGYGTVYKILNTRDNNVQSRSFDVSKDLYYSNRHLSEKVLSNEGGIYLPEGSAVFQYNNPVFKFKESYGNGLMENNLVLCDKNGKIIKTWNEGYIPKMQGCTAEEDETPLPISFLPSRNKISLLIRYETPEYRWKSVDPVPVWLAVLDLNSNRLHKITPVNMQMPKGTFDRILPLEWSVYSEREYIALSAPCRSPEDDGKQISSTIIFDVQRKKIMKRFNWESRTLRWSPDGRYLAMLRMNTFETINSLENVENDNVDQVGSFYVYDLKTDTIKKITQDKTYFDFFWLD